VRWAAGKCAGGFAMLSGAYLFHSFDKPFFHYLPLKAKTEKLAEMLCGVPVKDLHASLSTKYKRV
jgi:hypothetical protein